MNKKILLLIACMLTTFSLFAQDFQLSFSTGPSVNWLSSGESEITAGNVRAGYDFGVVADVFFDDRQRYAVTTGLLLTNTGGKLEYGDSGSYSIGDQSISAGNTLTFRLKYLEIPAAVKLKTSQFRRSTYWGQFGLSGFVNVGAKGSSSDGRLDKSDIQDGISAFNLAMNVGLGFDFDLGAANALSVGIIYKDGLTDITKDRSHDGKITVNSVNLKLGLIF